MRNSSENNEHQGEKERKGSGGARKPFPDNKETQRRYLIVIYNRLELCSREATRAVRTLHKREDTTREAKTHPKMVHWLLLLALILSVIASARSEFFFYLS